MQKVYRFGALTALAFAVLSGFPAATSAAPTGCVDPAFPDLPVCRANAHGIVLGRNAAEVEEVARQAAVGEVRFRKYFGEPPPYAVLIDPADEAASQALRAAGVAVILPWLSEAEKQRRLKESVRRAVESQIAGRGLGEEAVERMVGQALAQLEERREQASAPAGSAAVPHELGHLWFIHTYWGEQRAAGEPRYGGPGPDWLDEIAAVMMDGEDLIAPRREMFRRIYHGRAEGEIITLSDFLTMEHPTFETVKKLRESGQVGQGISIITGDEMSSRGFAMEGSIAFYSQVQVFADFLLERSGDPRIVAYIAEAISGGRTFEQWLAADAKRHQLGSSVAELDAIWRAWLEARYRDPAPATAR
jgi:hypothetical protein